MTNRLALLMECRRKADSGWEEWELRERFPVDVVAEVITAIAIGRAQDDDPFLNPPVDTSPRPADPPRAPRADLFGDVAALLRGDGPTTPQPTLLSRNDGPALLYPGQVNVLFGDPETGKTWVALAAVQEALKRTGARVAFIDIDHNTMPSVITRAQLLGIPDAVLADQDRFRYTEPDDQQDLTDAVTQLVKWSPTLVVVDSIGELIPMLGRNSNDGDDYTHAHRQVLLPLASAGAAVLAIDHLAKGSQSREFGAIGSTAKLRAVGGISLRATVESPMRPSPGHVGKVRLTVNKDRNGAVRAHCPAGERKPFAGMFTLADPGDGGPLVWDLLAPTDLAAVARPTPTDDVGALELLDPPPTSARDVAHRMRWGQDRARPAFHEYRQRHPDGHAE